MSRWRLGVQNACQQTINDRSALTRISLSQAHYINNILLYYVYDLYGYHIYCMCSNPIFAQTTVVLCFLNVQIFVLVLVQFFFFLHTLYFCWMLRVSLMTMLFVHSVLCLTFSTRLIAQSHYFTRFPS